jgi:hypothetical protein
MTFSVRAARSTSSPSTGTGRRARRATKRAILMIVVTGAALGTALAGVGPIWASSVPAGASNEVAVYMDGQTYRMVVNHVNLNPSDGEVAASRPF